MKQWMLIPAAAILLSMGVVLIFFAEKEVREPAPQAEDLYDGADPEEDETIRPLAIATEDFLRNTSWQEGSFEQGMRFTIRTEIQRKLAVAFICRTTQQMVLQASPKGFQIRSLDGLEVPAGFLEEVKRTVDASLRIGDRIVRIEVHHTSGNFSNPDKPAGWAILGEVGINYSRGLRYHSLFMPEGIPGEIRYRDAMISSEELLPLETNEPSEGEYVTVLGPIRLYGPHRRQTELRPGAVPVLRISRQLDLLDASGMEGMGIAGESVK